MSENTENTLSAYKGPEFQQRLMWQLLVEPEFAEKTITNLAIEYFDDPNLKRLFIIILEYFKKYEKVPNLQNQSIQQAINEFKSPNNVIEEESLFAIIKRVELWNERTINKQMLYDGDVVQKATSEFIKQQEYRKLGESIIEKVKSGAIRSKFEIINIEEKFHKIIHIGEDEDDCESVTEGIGKALRKEFRKTIPTGIGVIDTLTGGGLGRGEIGVILTPSGVGKTTALTIIANTAFEQEKNVAQVIFEDTKDQIKRKHYTIWAKSALSRLDDEEENKRVFSIATEHAKLLEGKGNLVIKRFSQENTTMVDVKNWMLSYQKKFGIKFDILVLDYLDCLESHKKSPDRNEAELAIIKGFEALASDFDIPAWTAIQSNRSGFGAEFVEAHQSGGSIKRIQKAHFFMSVAKTPAQQEANFANIRIIKARFAKDGQTFEDCLFNNDTMQIIIDDPRYRNSKVYKGLKHYDEGDINKFENHAEKLKDKSSDLPMHEAICRREDLILDKVNDDAVNGVISEAEKLNRLLRENAKQLVDIPPNVEFHPETEHHEKQILNGNTETPITETVKTESAEYIEKPESDFMEIMRLEIEAEARGEKYIPKKKTIENIHISTSRTDISQEEFNKILEFVEQTVIESENEIVKNEGVIPVIPLSPPTGLQTIFELDGEITTNDAVSDAVSDGVETGIEHIVRTIDKEIITKILKENEELLDWSGETFNVVTIEQEVTIKDISPPEEEKRLNLSDFESPELFQLTPPVVKKIEPMGSNLNDLMKQIQETDLDAPQGEHKSVLEMLRKRSEHQHVVKKE